MKVALRGILIVALITGCQPNSSISETEKTFQEVCIELLSVSESLMAGVEVAGEEEMVERWKRDLKAIIADDPESVWADDAHYVLKMCYIDQPEEQVALLEQLLERYPNMKFEDWTRECFPVLLPPEISLLLDSRVALAYLYRELGEKEKLRPLVLDLKAMFPDRPDALQEYEKYLEEP